MNITFDNQKMISDIGRFLTKALERSGLEGYVIGLSGGIDSALAAALAAQAVGPERVLGLLLPYRSSDQSSAADAHTLAEQLRINHLTIDISPMIDAFFPTIEPADRIRAGNKMARERMSILFDRAFQLNRLVLGTGNRTEIALGYTTLYGDSACSVNPIGELYKSEVRRLAADMDIPSAILTKAPSADLWAGQTDEQELGVTYENIDRLLSRIVDHSERSMKALLADGFAENDIRRVLELLNRNSFKRIPPPIAAIGRSEIPDRIELVE